MRLLGDVFGFRVDFLPVAGISPWDEYLSYVRDSALSSPRSSSDVLLGMAEIFHRETARSRITLSMPMDGIQAQVRAVIATLGDRERQVITLLYGLEIGASPLDAADVARQMMMSSTRVGQIKVKAFRKIRFHEQTHETLRAFLPKTVREIVSEYGRLRREIARLQERVTGLESMNDELSRAIQSGDPMTLLVTQGVATEIEKLSRRVDEWEASVRTQNCLQNAGIEYVWQLVIRTENDMLRTKNFGRKSMNEVKDFLSDMGLSLGMVIPPIVQAALPK